MKDKLEKHHLPKSHFLRKKILIIFISIFAVSAVVAIPVGVNIYIQTHVQDVNR